MTDRVRAPRSSHTGTGVETWTKAGLAGESGQKSLGPVQTEHTQERKRGISELIREAGMEKIRRLLFMGGFYLVVGKNGKYVAQYSRTINNM